MEVTRQRSQSLGFQRCSRPWTKVPVYRKTRFLLFSTPSSIYYKDRVYEHHSNGLSCQKDFLLRQRTPRTVGLVSAHNQESTTPPLFA